MMNITNKFNSQIDRFVVGKDFDSLLDLFETLSDFTFTDLKVFYKRKNKTGKKKPLFSLPQFWTSKLPKFYFRDILESDLKINFLQSYLASNENCNHELNEHLILIAKDDFIKHYKLWKAFNHSNFLSSLQQISRRDSEILVLKKEIEVIIKAQEKIENEKKKDEKYFLEFTIGDVLLGFTLYYYEFKQKKEIAGNKSLQIAVEMTLITELNKIILLFKEKNKADFPFRCNEELQEQFRKNKVPHHRLGEKNLERTPNLKFKEIYKLIDKARERNSSEQKIYIYLCGYSDFTVIDTSSADLTTNSSYSTFKINNAKSTPEATYFSNAKNFRTDLTRDIEFLNFYGIPDTIKISDSNIELKKLFQLLEYFSSYKGPVQRVFTPNKDHTELNQGDEKFQKLFGLNESISLFDFDKLIIDISLYFDWTEKEAKAILSCLTLDISEKTYPPNWIYSPFLKFNNQTLWLGSFVRDRNWNNILLNKFKKDREFKSLRNTLSSNFEAKIEELFKSKSFKTISREYFKSSDGQVGDFDVLAFRDNHLFVCEAKNGSKSDEFIDSTYLETVRLEGCAAEQLEKAKLNIQEDWANIKVKLDVNETIKFESIKIVPLIVTNYFEGDLKLYKNLFRKISLLELDVILNNKKKNLLDSYLKDIQKVNSRNSSFQLNGTSISNWDLWEGEKELTVEAIIRNIDENTVWNELENIPEFKKYEEYSLDF